MPKLVLDPDKSRIRIRTFAEGLFSRLAHDIELICRGVRGTCERASTDEGSASIEVDIAKIDVNGTLKNGRVDPNGLSPSDRADCLDKMRRDVFHSDDANAVVRVEAKLEAGKARTRVIPPKGRTFERLVTVRLEPEGDASTRVTGTFEVSLEAIGALTVKGPMNAFRVKDAVDVLFELVFSETR